MAHCGACHATFGGLGAFDRHRTRDGACRDPRELDLVARTPRSRDGRGVVWSAAWSGTPFWRSDEAVDGSDGAAEP